MATEEETSLEAIHRLYGEVVENGAKMKTLKADLKDVAEQNDEWRGLQDDIKELAAKKAQAKKLLEADRDYQVINSELAELKFKHKDLLEIMSHHLMLHRDKTGDDTIKDPEGEARHIIATAKLSKPDPLVVDSGNTRPSRKPLPGQVTLESELQGYGKPGGRSYEISSNKSDTKLVIDKDGTHTSPKGKMAAAGEE